MNTTITPNNINTHTQSFYKLFHKQHLNGQHHDPWSLSIIFSSLTITQRYRVIITANLEIHCSRCYVISELSFASNGVSIQKPLIAFHTTSPYDELWRQHSKHKTLVSHWHFREVSYKQQGMPIMDGMWKSGGVNTQGIRVVPPFHIFVLYRKSMQLNPIIPA